MAHRVISGWQQRGLGSLVFAWLAVAWLASCHASPDDAEGQAKELADPVRRQNALHNLARLHSSTLAKHGGNRHDPAVKALADIIAKPLNDMYVQHSEDTQNGLTALELMVELRDARTLDALLAALQWRPEVTEEHAVRAATALSNIDIAAEKRAQAVSALQKAHSKVQGARPIDNRLRRAMILALGTLASGAGGTIATGAGRKAGDLQAAAALAQIASQPVEGQNFLFQRLAAEQLAAVDDRMVLSDEKVLEALIGGLFLFDPQRPDVRMNDVAARGLVRVGRPALQPMLRALRGDDARVEKLAASWLQAIRQKNAAAAAALSVRQIVANEACYVLGGLGLPEASSALLAESKTSEMPRRIAAATALLRLNIEVEPNVELKEALQSVYAAAPTTAKPQLLMAMRNSLDTAFIPLFLSVVRDTEQHPVLRLSAFESAARLAIKAETPPLRQLIAAEAASVEGGYQEKFSEQRPWLDAAEKCNQSIACWQTYANGTDPLALRKAAVMLARLKRGDDAAIEWLLPKLSHGDAEVRLATLLAIDRIATSGSAAAVKKIAAMRLADQGKSIWKRIGNEATSIEARLQSRAVTAAK